MSKRAEELVNTVLSLPIGTPIPNITAMIDAELRKERERCAERAVAMAHELDEIFTSYDWLRAAILEAD